MGMGESKRSYLGLDLIRFGAAFLVMFFHFGFAWWTKPANAVEATLHAALRPIAPLASAGWVGVPIFFVLSGFVISFSAREKGWRDFIVGRCARLYPAAWICATITLLVIGPTPPSQYIGSILLSPVGPWISGV